jgi:hypothetical protein
VNHRTALIGAASLAAVVVAGVAAVGANLGILGTTDPGPIGELSAANLATAEPQTVDAGVEDAGPGVAGGQQFTVGSAGAVWLLSEGTDLQIDRVQPNSGWSWASSPASPGEVRVDFSSGAHRVAFVAVRNADGTITARADELAAGPDQTSSSVHPDDGDDDSHRDDDSDDDDRSGEEHEGRDDDD